MASFFTTSSVVGVDLNNTGTTQLYALGTRVAGTQNSEWVYAYTTTAVTAYKCVAVQAGGTMGMASGADVIAGYQLAFAQTSFAAGDYGWVAIRGEGLGVMTTGQATVTLAIANGQICVAASGASTGMVSNVATASGTISGVAFTSAQTTAGATVTGAIITWPRAQAGTAG